MANYTSSHQGSWHDDQFIKTEVFDKIYPIGSIYISVNSTNPSSLFGGTWVQIKDTFLLACGSNYSAGSTGGEASHTLVENELPKIDGHINLHGQEHGTHVYNVSGHFYGTQINGMYQTTGQTNGAYSQQSVGYRFGGNGAHNNMPPYLAVYMWKRTA